MPEASRSVVQVVPANEMDGDALDLVLGRRGPAAVCRCQRYKLAPRESFNTVDTAERIARMREQAECGNPRSTTTSGLVGLIDGVPVGWCAVEPRLAYPGLLRNFRVPWEGRDEDRTDAHVWAVTCFVTRSGFRRRGIAGGLLVAAVEHARGHGARALEGYPMVSTAAITEELHVGTRDMFAAAGFREVSNPTPRRIVMRIDFAGV